MASAAAYDEIMTRAGIQIDREIRRKNIWEEACAAAASVGGASLEQSGASALRPPGIVYRHRWLAGWMHACEPPRPFLNHFARPSLDPNAGVIAQTEAAEQLLDEVTDLVESPSVVLGLFDPDFLQLPEYGRVVVLGERRGEILVWQRFPLSRAKQTLTRRRASPLLTESCSRPSCASTSAILACAKTARAGASCRTF